MSKDYTCHLRVVFNKDTPTEVIDIFKKDAVGFESCTASLRYDKTMDWYTVNIYGDLKKHSDKIASFLDGIRDHIPMGYLGTMYPQCGARDDLIYIYNNADGIAYERVFE